MPLSRYEKQYLWAGLWYLEVQKDGSVKVRRVPEQLYEGKRLRQIFVDVKTARRVWVSLLPSYSCSRHSPSL